MKVHKSFWKVVRYLQWPKHYDDEIAKQRLLEYLTNHNDISFEEFKDDFEMVYKKINMETSDRVSKGKESFTDDYFGGDDKHFLDLPAHLIGNGKKAVTDYLAGGLVDEDAKECLSYMFQDFVPPINSIKFIKSIK
jgi:hypothetical protein